MSTGDVVAITVEAVWLVIKCADVNYIFGNWFDHQYLPDSDFYSGADADVCTEDDLCIFVTHHLWRLDLE